MPTYPFTDWVAEQLRLTVFIVPTVDNHPAEHWWQASTGAAPEESSANQRMGVKTLAGAFQGGKLMLKFEPGRIDWFLNPGEPNPDPGFAGEPLTIGPVVEALEAFSRVVEAWLGRNDLPNVLRIAFGGIVRHAERDMRSAYLRLPDYLPVRVPPDATDFFFQVNLPTESRTQVEGLRINRLSKWSISALTRMALRVEGGMLVPVPAPILGFALRAELDVNTAPEFQGPLPPGRLSEVYRELVGMARAIVTEGLNIR